MKKSIQRRSVSGLMTYIPEIKVPTDEGVRNNRDLPEGVQIRAEIALASKGKIESYFQTKYQAKKEGTISFHSRYDDCIAKQVRSIAGLEEYGISDGASLLAHQTDSPVFIHLVGDLFNAVCSLKDEEELAGE